MAISIANLHVGPIALEYSVDGPTVTYFLKIVIGCEAVSKTVEGGTVTCNAKHTQLSIASVEMLSSLCRATTVVTSTTLSGPLASHATGLTQSLGHRELQEGEQQSGPGHFQPLHRKTESLII